MLTNDIAKRAIREVEVHLEGRKPVPAGQSAYQSISAVVTCTHIDLWSANR